MTEEKIKQGKQNRARGKRFELFVRKNLEDKGWIVCKWANNVEGGKLVSAKHKYNPFSKMLSLGTGFPDFIAFRKVECPECITPCGYKIIGVESKFGKYLDRIEKEKVKWLLENNIFDDIWIAFKGKKRGEIVYEIQL
jgi:hypothetical protein